jgi:hypothetical protein
LEIFIDLFHKYLIKSFFYQFAMRLCMSFTISNSVYAIQGRLETNLLNTNNLFTSLGDFAFIASISIIGGLMLGGVLNFGLPIGVGTIGNHLAWSFIGLSVSIVVADIITAIAIKNSTDNLVRMRSRYHDLIADPHVIEPSLEEIVGSRRVPCHQIIKGRYLGKNEAFTQTTHLKCFAPDKNGRPELIDTSNPLNFKTVITLCPWAGISADYNELQEKGPKETMESFEKNAIKWHFVGKLAEDEPRYWEALAYDCTHVDTELAKKDMPKEGLQEAELEQIRQEKSDVMSNTPVQEWFEPIFQEIDEGVFNGKRVLVHCQAGRSRSASILAAYLINRFNVSSNEAIAFLKSRRPCIEIKFTIQLNAYAEALQATL